jgi:hypothetical protein
MKIIDKTPLVDEKGSLGITQRIQGMLQFGFNWPRELEIQKAIVSYFDRQLEKGYTLIRNMPLGASGIVIPMIVVGPTGIFVIQVTYLKGRYEAKGDSWNMESGNQYKPAPVNLIKATMLMARALQAFIERQGVKVPTSIDAVLIAGEPGLHIDSVRPAIKVMIDGIKSFVSGLATGRPVISAEAVLTDRAYFESASAKESVSSRPDRAAWEQQEPPQQEVAGAQFSAPPNRQNRLTRRTLIRDDRCEPLDEAISNITQFKRAVLQFL